MLFVMLVIIAIVKVVCDGNTITCKKYLIIRATKNQYKKVIPAGKMKHRLYLHRKVPA